MRTQVQFYLTIVAK